MGSILAPVEPPAYRDGHADFYGAVEVDRDSGDPVWQFDAPAAGLEVGNVHQTPQGVVYRGFRPSSVERLDDGLTLVSEWRGATWVDEDGNVLRREDHTLLNEVHEVQKTDRGTFLAASTGLDTLVEFDEDWHPLWTWHMWEHVPRSARPDGYYPHIVTGRDVREVAFSPDERFHLNYVTELDEETLLCSARLYGVFTVDKPTGEITAAFTDVAESHNPVDVEEGIVLCESGRDRVVRTDMSAVTEVLFEGGLAFVKDADPLGDGEWLVTDTKNDRVLVWERGADTPEEVYDLPTGAKPYESDYLEGDRSKA